MAQLVTVESIMKGSQGRDSRYRNLVAGAEAETMEEHCFLAWCFLTQLRTTWLGVALPTVGWTLPHQSLTKKMSIYMPTDQSIGDSFSVEVPYFQVTLVSVKLISRMSLIF